MDIITISLLLIGVALLSIVFTFTRQKCSRRYPPTLKATSKIVGNLPDIEAAGSIHEFLVSTHRKLGPIFSFWFNKDWVVSIDSAETFQQQVQAYDRPGEIYGFMESLFGKTMIVNVNGNEAKRRRNAYDRCLNQDVANRNIPTINVEGRELVHSLRSISECDEFVSVLSVIKPTVFKTVTICLFGGNILTSAEVKEFNITYTQIFEQIQKWLQTPEASPTEDSAEYLKFQDGRLRLRKIVDAMVVNRQLAPPREEKDTILMDAMIATCSKDVLYDEVFNMLIASISTTSNTLCFCLYYLCQNPALQETAFEEINRHIGTHDVTVATVSKLVFIRQLINETLRCACVAPFCARYNATTSLGGFYIPDKTPIIHALGSSFKREDVWDSPDRFDPDRFCPMQTKKRHQLSFAPFGFGKRKCPGEKFALTEMTILLTHLVRAFQFKFEVDKPIIPVFGFVTHPGEEIRCTLVPRH